MHKGHYRVKDYASVEVYQAAEDYVQDVQSEYVNHPQGLREGVFPQLLLGWRIFHGRPTWNGGSRVCSSSINALTCH